MGCGASAAKYAKMVDQGETPREQATGAKGLGDFPPSEESAVALTKALVHQQAEVRQAAWATLDKYGKEGAALVVPKLQEILKSEFQTLDTQGYAFAALGHIAVAIDIDVSQVLQSLEEILLEDGHVLADPARQLLKQLGEKANDVVVKIVPVVARKGVDVSLRTPQKLEAQNYLASLAHNGLPVVPELTKMLNGTDIDDRKAALGALKACGPELAADVVPDLIKAVQDDSDPDNIAAADVRCQALGVLGNYGESEGVLPLFMEHLDEDFRMIALDGLQRMGKTAAPALPRVIKVLEEDFPECGETSARQAVAIIQNIGLPEAESALPVVTPLCDHEWPDLKADAIECVRVLGGGA